VTPLDPDRSEAAESVVDAREDAAAAFAPGERDPRTRFEHRGELGVGAMGRVWVAFDRWLGREVALKEPRSLEAAERFSREALLTARLEHPGIVPVYDVGASPEGRPWFAMRIVRGRALDTVLAERSSASERLELLRNLLVVCETVAFAHDRGVVHRDLKPANVMLGAFGQTQVIDWGLALSPEREAPVASGAGTPRYMSPEQARGEPVGPATDVFSLGAILFEVIAGRPAFPQATAAEAIGALRRGDVPPLASAFPDVPADLAAIVDRAMAVDQARRYPSAAALAADLARYLDGRRVTAHDYSAAELLRRLLRAWRRPLAVAAVALALLVAVVAFAFVRVETARADAEANLAIALASASSTAARAHETARAEVLAAHALARAPLPEARGVLATLSPVRPQRIVGASPPCAPFDLAGERVACRDLDGVSVGDAAGIRWRARVGEPIAGPTFIDHGDHVVVSTRQGVVVLDAADGRLVSRVERSTSLTPLMATGDPGAALGMTRTYIARYRASGVEESPWTVCPEPGVAAANLHPDGDLYAAACFDGSLAVGSFERGLETRADPRLLRPGDFAGSLAFIPGTRDLLIGTDGGSVLRLDAPRYERDRVHRGAGFVHRVMAGPRGERAVVISDLGDPIVLDLASMAPLARLTGVHGRAISFDADGTLRAVGERLERWAFDGVVPRGVRVHHGIAALAVSHDGRHLAIANGPELAVVDVATRARLGRISWDEVLVKDLTFGPEGALYAHGMGTPSVVRFDDMRLDAIASALPVPISRRIGRLADGRMLSVSWLSGVQILGADQPPQPVDAELFLNDMEVSRTGREVVGIDPRGGVWVGRDLHAGGELAPCGVVAGARSIARNAEDGTVFVATRDGVHIACGPSGDDLAHHPGGDSRLIVVATASNWVAAGAQDGTVLLWRRGEREPFAVHRAHEGRVSELVFAPRAEWLAAGGWDGYIGFMHMPPPETGDPPAVESAWGLTLVDAFERGTRGAAGGPTR